MCLGTRGLFASHLNCNLMFLRHLGSPKQQPGLPRLDEEQKIVDETKLWIEQRADQQPGLKHYLEYWGDWQPPESQVDQGTAVSGQSKVPKSE